MSLVYEPAGRAREYAPLALNLYAGCTHGCRYCYAPAACHKNPVAFHAAATPRADLLAKLERELVRRPNGPDDDGDYPPVLLCFTSDPYQPLAAETGLTRGAIELLHAHNYPVHVLTKGGTRAAADFDILGERPGDAFAATLTFTDPDDSAAWEPNAAPPDDRLEALSLAHAAGITTWASLEPVLDPEQTLELIRRTHRYVDLFKVGTLNHHEHAHTIDWPAFARRAVALLDELGASYYLKQDLRRHMAA